MPVASAPERVPFGLTQTDLENLAGGDERFQPHDWEDLKHIIGSTCPVSLGAIISLLSVLDSGKQSCNFETQAIGSTTLYRLDEQNQVRIHLHYQFCLQSAASLEACNSVIS